MVECVLTMRGRRNSGASETNNSNKKIIGFELDILGETLSFNIEVGNERAKLSDIVPIAHTLSDRITDVIVQHERDKGNRIPCDKGCSSCCRRCLIPMSIPEALRFKEEIDAAPLYRQESIWKSCLQAARHILSHKLPKSFIYHTEASQAGPVNLSLVSNWYTSMKLVCPFLNIHVCGIYNQRPLACREHFIKGSARACKGLRGISEVLEMPVQLPNVLGQLASELEGTDVEAVILPLAPIWCRENPERAEKTWPAEMMVTRFVEIIETTAQQNLPKVTTQKPAIVSISKKQRAKNRLYQVPLS